MAAVAPVGRQRALDVDRIAWHQPLQIGAPDRLGCEAHFELVLVELSHREAHAVDGDAAAKGGSLERDGCLHLELPALANRAVPLLQPRHLVKLAHLAHLLDDAAEHGLCNRRTSSKQRHDDAWGRCVQSANGPRECQQHNRYARHAVCRGACSVTPD